MPVMQPDVSHSNYKALPHSAQWARKRHEQVDIASGHVLVQLPRLCVTSLQHEETTASILADPKLDATHACRASYVAYVASIVDMLLSCSCLGNSMRMYIVSTGDTSTCLPPI